ncbi:MAG: hypothetical protein COS08_00475, partial [Euryarchaeota archaeon CG01_land_8_20_14_3_00_38_12]
RGILRSKIPKYHEISERNFVRIGNKVSYVFEKLRQQFFIIRSIASEQKYEEFPLGNSEVSQDCQSNLARIGKRGFPMNFQKLCKQFLNEQISVSERVI